MLTFRSRSLVSDPIFRRMNGLWPDFDRLFTNFFATEWPGSTWMPPVEVDETGERIRYLFEVPGIRPEDISLTVERNVLTISGEKKAEHVEENTAYHLSERRYGRFTRSFRLPAGVDADAVSANYENGLLTITLPKAPAARPRAIPIEAGSSQRLTEASDSAE